MCILYTQIFIFHYYNTLFSLLTRNDAKPRMIVLLGYSLLVRFIHFSYPSFRSSFEFVIRLECFYCTFSFGNKRMSFLFSYTSVERGSAKYTISLL